MRRIRDVRQLRLLASPLRQAILDVLESTGPCPVVELAQLLGRRADALYYHLRLLTNAGLLVERRGRGRRACAVYGLRRRGATLEYRPSSGPNRAAVNQIVATMLRDASRSFRRAFVAGEVVMGLHRAVWAGRCMGWLTPAELARVNAGVAGINAVLAGSVDRKRGARLFAFTHVIAPYRR